LNSDKAGLHSRQLDFVPAKTAEIAVFVHDSPFPYSQPLSQLIGMSHISSSLKEAVATRRDVTQTSEYCPRQAYVELYVPLDMKAVRIVTFMTVS